MGILLLSTAGCAKPAKPGPVDEEPVVRTRFEELQKALKERDPERLSFLLSIESQADAQGIAHYYRGEFARADDKKRQEYAKELGISLEDMSRFNGPMFLKTRPFLEKYEEARDGKFERASVQGDNATIYFRDDEGDREKLFMIRENGEWRFWLKMPSVHRATEDKDKKDKPGAADISPDRRGRP